MSTFSSGSGSNDISTAAQAQGDELTPNTLEIGLVGKDRTKWEHIKFSSESRGQATNSERANRKRSLTRYENRMLDGPLSAFELLVNNSMLTHV